jgi:hypothetical protein
VSLGGVKEKKKRKRTKKKRKKETKNRIPTMLKCLQHTYTHTLQKEANEEGKN